MDPNLVFNLTHDCDFRRKFIQSPSEMLATEGFTEFAGKKIIVHENSNVCLNFCLLPREAEFLETVNLDPRFMNIQKKAWADDEFRAKLLSDTRSALAEFFEAIPEHLMVNIFENTSQTLHVVLPALETDNDELNDNDLDLVAGGKGNVIETVTEVTETIQHLPRDILESLMETGGKVGGIVQEFVSPVTDPVHDFFHKTVFDPITETKDKLTSPLDKGVDGLNNKFQSIYALSGW